jgi:hypothetical protein
MEYDITQLADEGLFACQLTLLTPFHGTKLWKQMEHLVNEPDLSKFDLYNLVWKHPKMSPSEARDLMAWAQRKVNDPGVVAQKIKQDMKEKLRREMAAKRGQLPIGSRPSRLGGGMAAGAFAAPER